MRLRDKFQLYAYYVLQSTGEVIVNDSPLSKMKENELAEYRAKEIGFIFQFYNLIPTLTVYENVALMKDIKDDILNPITILERVGLKNHVKKFPNQLSGGEQQSVSIARAITKNPEILLCDEPTGALDSKSARLLLERLESLNEELSATILMVTHDAFTASYAHRILFIKDGKIFTELVRGNDSRKEFFNRIMEVITMLGGDDNNVF